MLKKFSDETVKHIVMDFLKWLIHESEIPLNLEGVPTSVILLKFEEEFAEKLKIYNERFKGIEEVRCHQLYMNLLKLSTS